MAGRDARLCKGRLEALRIGPGVLAAAHAAPLAHVEHETGVRSAQRREKRLERPAVDADREQLRIQNTATLGEVRALTGVRQVHLGSERSSRGFERRPP